MENFKLNEDIKLIYVEATSFPEGIEDAFQKLYAILGTNSGRKFYGISFPDSSNKITYKASVSQAFEDENVKLNLPIFVLKKGEYDSILLKNYTENLDKITSSFDKLITDPRVDPEGCCVEEYLPDNSARLMVRRDPLHHDRQLLLASLQDEFRNLREIISNTSEEQLNKKIPTSGWTAAQIADHLSKSYGIYTTLNGKVEDSDEINRQNIQNIKDTFLNFDIKMQSPEFIIPANGMIDKNSLLEEVEKNTEEIFVVLHTRDLSKKCIEFEFPGGGAMSRLEWLYLVLYHTQRHIHQMKNVLNKITQDKDLQVLSN